MGTLTTVFGHILNIASGQSTKQEQNYRAKQNAGSRIGAADQSETHFSRDTVDRVLWLAILCSLLYPGLKRTGTFASESKVMYFILLILRSDVLMFHS